MAGTGDKLLTAAEIKEVTDTKINISDVVNALNSTSTNKPLSAAQGKVLNDAKVDKTDTIAIEHGGTNAETVADARTNLSVYSKSEVDTAIAQSTATLASYKRATWNQSTTTGSEYSTVIDLDPAQDMPSGTPKIVFVYATYASGRPFGLRIGVATTTTGNVEYVKTIESNNYQDLSNGIFICIASIVRRLVIQEKLVAESGSLNGAAMILAL